MSNIGDSQIDVNGDLHEDNAKNAQNTFSDNEHIILNDGNENEGIANVVNTPVAISTSEEQTVGIEIIHEEPPSSFFSKIKNVLNPLLTPFYKLGKFLQSLISDLSDKVNIQSSYKYFLIFLALGMLFFFFSLFYIPFFIFNPGKLLRLLSFGNIFIMLSFLFHYGSKDFFAFILEEKRVFIVLSHIFLMLFGLFFSLFIGGYFIQLLLDILLCSTTIMFVLTLVPGGQSGISGIKNMLLGPLFFLFTTIKRKIFGDSSISDLAQ